MALCRRLATYKITLAGLSSDVVDSSYFYALKYGFLPLYHLALFEVFVIIVSPASAIMMNADAITTGFRPYTRLGVELSSSSIYPSLVSPLSDHSRRLPASAP
jgi:hypothetical protein